ncbi:hypothetical protein [Terriglobus albidus]|uniref:hypothetical protein n=1 Tax=Terriglobus albidus TaxID=1592106 RepID=UPI0021DF8AC9|nr:hypothetical protein [Terriglobus albidus]
MMRYRSLTVSFSVLILWTAGFAQAGETKDVLGEWSGKSTCVVRPSACHDEDVIYQIKEIAPGKLSWKADKIVSGKRETMGVLDCSYGDKTLVCHFEKGTWTFHVDGARMTGTLRLVDGRLFRTVDVKRE